jgi:ABC-type Zn uptake system ZnuABC Zn-binding protein ZnuA
MPRVLAAESFLADIAQHVAGDRLSVEALLPPGVDPHEFQTSPRDAIKIAEARLFIVNGMGYESWLTTLAAAPGDQILIEASTGVVPAVTGDPHQWMDPRQVVRYTENIRDGLSGADPAGSAVYAANAQAYILQLRELDEWIKDEVAALPTDRRVLVTNHDALRSFAAAYGFRVVGLVVPGFSTEAKPSAQQMAGLIDTIRLQQVPVIFLDISENQELADQIASESGARVVTGLYVETLSGPNGPAPTYLGMLKHDVNLIVDALK